ncbi:MAG: hypothetical protein ACPGVG_14735, partial [Mycobacterium sp.]
MAATVAAAVLARPFLWGRYSRPTPGDGVPWMRMGRSRGIAPIVRRWGKRRPTLPARPRWRGGISVPRRLLPRRLLLRRLV